MIKFIFEYMKILKKYDKFYLLRRIFRVALVVSTSYITINLVNWLVLIYGFDVVLKVKLLYIAAIFGVLIILGCFLESVVKQINFANESFTIRFKHQLFDFFEQFTFEQFESASIREQIYSKQKYVDNMRWGLIEPIESILEQTANCILVIGIILTYDFQIALLLLIGFSVLGSIYINKWYVLTNFKKANHWGKLSNYNRAISTQFSGVNDRLKESKLNSSTNQMRKLLINYNKMFMQLRLEITKIDLKFETIQLIITCSSNAIATIIVVSMYYQGIISLGQFTVVMLAIGKLTMGLITISKELSVINAASQFGDEISQIISSKEKEPDETVNIKTIEFVNVSFKYPGSEQYALHNISAVINSDISTAIIGANGSGKTTFIKLLLGIYKPTEGKILVNGIEYDDYSLLNNLTCIAQDSQMYKLTLRENLPAIDDEHRKKVLELVGMGQYGECLDKVVGRDFADDGLEFSGGQVQKLLVARAYLSQKQWLIADEPTSNVDPISEEYLLSLLLDSKYCKTRIIVSHRLSVLTAVDNIIVIDNGHIEENGNFQQLFSKRGIMYEQYSLFKSMYF